MSADNTQPSSSKNSSEAISAQPNNPPAPASLLKPPITRTCINGKSLPPLRY